MSYYIPPLTICLFVTITLVVLFTDVIATDEVKIDISKTTSFSHYWKRSFGSGHATLTLRKDWRGQLKQAINDLGLQGIRHHGILDDDMRVVIAPRKYNFTLVEESWSFQVLNNITPIVELSFMPAILANCTWKAPADGRIVNPGHKPCIVGMQYKNIQMPPTSFDDWYDLVNALVRHAVDTFGIEEVKTWKFECWNELWGMPFPEVYMKLYNASALAVKAVNPSLKVGGPATAQLLDLKDFIAAARKINAPFDFISTHMYPTDPMCPTKSGWGPDCLPKHVQAAKIDISNAGVPLYLTEYNVGCCIGYPQHDVSGAAAFAFRTIGALDGITDVLSWWTFSDIFEEGTAVDEHTEFMNIYGLMTISGVPKPGWRAFQLLHQHAGNTRIKATVTESVIYDQLGLIDSSSHQANCTIEDGTEFSGFDIGTAPTAKTLDECCNACRSNNLCSFWTFFHTNSSCYLKTSDAGRTHTTKDVTSGSSTLPPKPSGKGTRIAALVTSNDSMNNNNNVLLKDQFSSKSGISVFLSFWSINGTESDRSVNVMFVNDTTNMDNNYNDICKKYLTTATMYRIDENNCNPFAKWKSMGSPGKPTIAQVEELIKASELKATKVSVNPTTCSLIVNMPPNSAVVLVF